jgi:3-hydroxyisobutyrate dehydrogenase-like beta-hydroxyacid dehydrogenase
MTMTTVSVLGLGAMGRALAGTLLTAGHPTTVWNRTPGKDTALVAAGVTAAETPAQAVRGGDLVVLCLLDAESVEQTMRAAGDGMAGRSVVNVTTVSPEEARRLAELAARYSASYLDGGIMAVPEMIGLPGASLLYSGDTRVFENYLPILRLFGEAEYFGEDAGLASVYDFALLSGMYSMFTGFFHGAAMLRAAGVSAAEFAPRLGRWLTAMTALFPQQAQFIDGGDFTTDVQSLAFNKLALDAIGRASTELDVAADSLGPLRSWIDAEVTAGNGAEALPRVITRLTANH